MEARGPPPRCRSGRERSPRTASRAGYIDVRSFRCGELRLRRSEVLFVTRVEGEECVGDRPERKALRDVVGEPRPHPATGRFIREEELREPLFTKDHKVRGHVDGRVINAGLAQSIIPLTRSVLSMSTWPT